MAVFSQVEVLAIEHIAQNKLTVYVKMACMYRVYVRGVFKTEASTLEEAKLDMWIHNDGKLPNTNNYGQFIFPQEFHNGS